MGERRIIELFLGSFARELGEQRFLNDDVAIVELGGGKAAILKCDMLVASTDVPPGMSFWQAGRKAVVSTVSDFAAKGVKPSALLVSVGIPRDMREPELREVARGLAAGAKEYGLKILGGDTNESKELVIDCVGYGICEERRLILRSGAKPGDLLASTGRFGAAPAGLRAILEGAKVPEELRRELVKAVYSPRAHLREGLALADSGAATASIDSSDGLAWSLFELSRASGVGFLIENLPMDAGAARFAKLAKLDPTDLALYGGEEFNLVVTVKRDGWERAKGAVEAVGGELHPLGEAIEGEGIFLALPSGETVEVKPKGWEHLRK